MVGVNITVKVFNPIAYISFVMMVEKSSQFSSKFLRASRIQENIVYVTSHITNI